MMLWIRGLVFTILVPAVIAGAVPYWIDPNRTLQDGWWRLGWPILGAGAAIYAVCLLRFLAAGGTPAIFFTRPLRFLIGEEPDSLVRSGIYAHSRNPMYVGVILAAAGQAIVFASRPLAIYTAMLAAAFHLVVVLIEEPHLRTGRGEAYEEY